jgi:hypothetical protein
MGAGFRRHGSPENSLDTVWQRDSNPFLKLGRIGQSLNLDPESRSDRFGR